MNPQARRTAGRADFTKLYAELGVEPACGMTAFKQAYRRRVAELHPDRPTAQARDPEQLIALNLGYAAALEFQREYGRLPGAPPPARAGAGTTPGGNAADTPAPQPTRAVVPLPAAATPVAPGSWRRLSVRRMLLPALLLIALAWHWMPGLSSAPAEATPAHQPAASAAEAAPPMARQGMDRRTVAQLLGEPVARDISDSFWVYGPSWVRFECGRLADWYSSPLHPLRVASQQPAADAPARHAREPESILCLETLPSRTGDDHRHAEEDA